MTGDDRHDARTAARVRAIREGCSLPVAGVHGSLVGRAAAPALGAAMEPGGRHAAVLLRGAVERWDLDAIECVGRWDAPEFGWIAHVEDVPRIACVGAAPAGVRVVDPKGVWGAPRRDGDGWRLVEGFTRGSDSAGWGARDVEVVGDEGGVRAVRLDDGATLWRMSLGEAFVAQVARGGGTLLLRRSSTSFDVAEAVASPASRALALLARAVGAPPPGPRVLARLAMEAPSLGRRVALHAGRRLVAIPTRIGVVVGPWDDWRSARTVPVGHEAWALVDFTDDGSTLVLGAATRILRVDVATMEVRETPTEEVGRLGGPLPFAALDGASGRVLYVAGSDLFIADAGGGAARARASDPVGGAALAVGTPDGRSLVTLARDGALRVRDRASGEVLAQMEGGECTSEVAVSADGRELYVVGARQCLQRFDRATGELIGRVEWPFGRPFPGLCDVAVSPDGRRIALRYGEMDRAGVLADVLDLTTGAWRQLERGADGSIAMPHGSWGIAIEPSATWLRHLGDFYDGANRVAARCTACRVEGGAAEVLVQWPGETADFQSHRLSRDGRLLWRIRTTGSEPSWVAVTAVDPPARLGYARWRLDGREEGRCAGRSLLAVVTSVGSLWLLSGNGRAVRSPWPGRCVPLAFAPDDRALWVSDESGLVVELTVPGELLDDAG